jgi:hypothetical protein
VLRKIFAPQREEVTEEWRKLHTMEVHHFTKYYVSNRIKENEMGHAACNGK